MAAAIGIFLPVYLVVVLLAPSYKRWAKNSQLTAFVRAVTAAATGAIAGAVVTSRSAFSLCSTYHADLGGEPGRTVSRESS
jgi:chromate transport protein ChrA